MPKWIRMRPSSPNGPPHSRTPRVQDDGDDDGDNCDARAIHCLGTLGPAIDWDVPGAGLIIARC